MAWQGLMCCEDKVAKNEESFNETMGGHTDEKRFIDSARASCYIGAHGA
jgi:hypothetical protein